MVLKRKSATNWGEEVKGQAAKRRRAPLPAALRMFRIRIKATLGSDDPTSVVVF